MGNPGYASPICGLRVVRVRHPSWTCITPHQARRARKPQQRSRVGKRPAAVARYRIDRQKAGAHMKSLNSTRHVFQRLLRISEFLGLVVIGISTTFAMAHETWKMVSSARVTLTDLLLMFLFLEILAMVTQYIKSGQLPVRFPLYIAIVALARELILNMEHASKWHMLASAGAIFILALGVLLIRYGQSKYPSSDDALREEDPEHQ
jgi:protein PsiE